MCINFGSVVPHFFLPTIADVEMMFRNQLGNDIGINKLMIEKDQRKKGFFNLTVLDKAVYENLVGKSISVDYPVSERKNAKIETKKIPLQPITKKMYQRARYIKISKSYDFNMVNIPDCEFDSIFKKYGTIIVPTKAASRDGILTGQRELRVDLTKEIERKIEVIFATTSDGIDYAIESTDNDVKYTCSDTDTIRAKGTLLIYYPDQRYRCTKCSNLGVETFHTTKCPLKILEDNAFKKAKEEHEQTVDTLMIGTSNLRRINQFATKAKVLSSSGARIGHTANQLRHETTENYKYIVLQTGDNNYDPTINIDERLEDKPDKTLKEQATKYCNQQNNEIEQLTETILDPIHKDSTIIIIDPLETPAHKTNPNLARQRLRLRLKLKQMADKRQKLGQRTIFLEDTDLNDKDKYDDKNHLNSHGTQALLDTIEQEHTLRRDNMSAITDKLYSLVTPIPRIGCLRCCSTAHETSQCTIEPKKTSTPSTEPTQRFPPTTTSSDSPATDPTTTPPDTSSPPKPQPNPSRNSASRIANSAISTINGFIQNINNDSTRRIKRQRSTDSPTSTSPNTSPPSDKKGRSNTAPST